MDETLEYSSMYLEAMKEIRMAHEALTNRNYQAAYEHCLNAQTEMKLMTGAVKTWLPVEESRIIKEMKETLAGLDKLK